MSVQDAAAMGDAALAGDFDEARFRTQIIAAKADAGVHVDLIIAAAHLVVTPGPPGSLPGDGYGEGTHWLTSVGSGSRAYAPSLAKLAVSQGRQAIEDSTSAPSLFPRPTPSSEEPYQ